MSSYFDFFNHFRSPPAEVKRRQSAFLKYFEGCKRVVDIGCGRGEFLELLAERGIGGEGVDIDGQMAEHCRDRGLSAHRKDAVSYLEGQQDGSLDGIFTDDTVEHMEMPYLLKMLELCARKLEPERFMVAITVNPLSWAAYANIYLIDSTHKSPLHPEAMRYYMTASGFREVSIEYTSYLPEEERLRPAAITRDMDADARRLAQTYNRNIQKLNQIIFGPENYAAIAKK